MPADELRNSITENEVAIELRRMPILLTSNCLANQFRCPATGKRQVGSNWFQIIRKGGDDVICKLAGKITFPSRRIFISASIQSCWLMLALNTCFSSSINCMIFIVTNKDDKLTIVDFFYFFFNMEFRRFIDSNSKFVHVAPFLWESIILSIYYRNWSTFVHFVKFLRKSIIISIYYRNSLSRLMEF